MYAAPTNREFIDWMDDESSAPFSKKKTPANRAGVSLYSKR